MCVRLVLCDGETVGQEPYCSSGCSNHRGCLGLGAVCACVSVISVLFVSLFGGCFFSFLFVWWVGSCSVSSFLSFFLFTFMFSRNLPVV